MNQFSLFFVRCLDCSLFGLFVVRVVRRFEIFTVCGSEQPEQPEEQTPTVRRSLGPAQHAFSARSQVKCATTIWGLERIQTKLNYLIK